LFFEHVCVGLFHELVHHVLRERSGEKPSCHRVLRGAAADFRCCHCVVRNRFSSHSVNHKFDGYFLHLRSI
jgi:hypothetical protein